MTPGATTDVQIRPLTFETRGLTLRGTAHMSDTGGPSSTVVLCHGFTGNRIETGRLFVTLARRLTETRFASVAFDRQGHGESDGEFFDTNVTDDVADTHALLDHIAKLEFVDEKNIHLLGFSMGAVIASVVAAETDLPVRSLTMWSPAAVFADNARAGGLPGKPQPRTTEGEGFDFEGLLLGPGFQLDAATWDPYGRATGYEGPVRILHGDQDFIPVEYAQRYEEIYGPRAKITIVAGADHTWNTVRARKILISETAEFIRSTG